MLETIYDQNLKHYYSERCIPFEVWRTFNPDPVNPMVHTCWWFIRVSYTAANRKEIAYGYGSRPLAAAARNVALFYTRELWIPLCALAPSNTISSFLPTLLPYRPKKFFFFFFDFKRFIGGTVYTGFKCIKKLLFILRKWKIRFSYLRGGENPHSGSSPSKFVKKLFSRKK